MKVLVTGAEGFIGKNLVKYLELNEEIEIYQYTKDSSLELLDKYTIDCDIIFHLAGVNRTNNTEDFKEGNTEFTSQLISSLKSNKNKAKIVYTSSIQAELENDYGKSKLEAENILFDYANDNKSKVIIYRLKNIFGKWSKPNYNTVVATFCYNISRDIPISINNGDTVLSLCYIDDLVLELNNCITDDELYDGSYAYVPTVYNVSLSKLETMIREFKDSRINLKILESSSNKFKGKLYATYLSFLDINDFSYDLKMNIDERGSFTEFLKFEEKGQVSVNISKPGIVKGNHWHNTKNEKFLVVHGDAIVKFRSVFDDSVIEYKLSGDKLIVVDIPTGYTHSIENISDSDLVTIMWANEEFNLEKPDTVFLKV